MSLTLLSDKLDKLNEKEKLIRLTYDVRGNNKHQHRFIADLKQDFKEDLELRYGNKPYGLGWNQDSEIDTERDADNQDDEQQEQIPEDDEDLEKENGDIVTSAFSPNANFRPTSGKISAFGAQNRPFSASTIRPMTASSTGGNSGAQKFMFPGARPISAISGVKKHFSTTNQEISESYMFGAKSPQSMQQTLTHEELARMQASNVNSNGSAKMRANESIFWKNTKKFDIAQSSKQFYTKQLVFDVAHSDPKLISSADLEYLRGAKMHGSLENSKLKAPKNYVFEEVAKSKRSGSKGKNLTTGGDYDNDSVMDAKSMFNQSLSYIHSLRNDAKVNNTTVLKEYDTTSKTKKHQRPMTAHPLIPSTTSNITTKMPLETVKEHVPENSRIYFSSLSDLRKKAFFLKLHSLEPAAFSHPSLTKELKLIEWDCFKDLQNQPDFQSLHVLIMDLNSFDHVRYELDFAENGRVQAKDKEDLREVLDVYKDFVMTTRTNIASIIIYYESANNSMLELFSRVLVYEKQEDEYDLIVWRNIYRYVLYKIILANAPLYPDCKTYQDFSRMIKDIIEDKKDYVSPVSPQIQQTKDHPIVVERNSHVYNFDFHSYILECSSFYSQSLNSHNPTAPPPRKDSKTIDKKARPYSAVASNSQFSAFGNRQFQKSKDNTLRETSNIHEPSFFTPQKPHSPYTTMPNSTQNASRDKLAATLSNVIQGSSQPVLSTKRGSAQTNPIHSLRTSHDRIDFGVTGGRMEIYPDMWAASNTMKTNWKTAGMNSLQFSPEYKRFSSSAMQTPKGFNGVFQQDSNGITMKQNVNAMKKHSTTVVIQKRPYSAQKKPIKPHVVGGNLPITMFLSGASNSRNKF